MAKQITQQEYEAAQARVSELMDIECVRELGKNEELELQGLAWEMAAYEEKHGLTGVE